MKIALVGLVALVALFQCVPFSAAEELQQVLQITGMTVDEPALMVAHNTARYRGADGKPQTSWLILRRGRAINGTVKTNVKPPSGWQVQFCLVEIRDADATPNRFCDGSTFKPAGDGTESVVTSNLASNLPVGKYRLVAQVTDGSRMVKALTYEPNRKDRNVAVLMDPYNPRELMYTNNTNFINEFLHNERGAFWVGTSNDYQFRPWSYDHFNIEVFEQVINLVTKHVSPLERKDAVALSRAVAGLPRNSKETVLVGKWDPPYDDGVFPPAWLSSYDIFKTFRDKKSAAKYGQCMIFAAFTTTWFRALGFPARPITIFDFATVASDKREVNMYWDLSADGKYYTAAKNNSDKLWGFHAVTEILLKRKDDTEAKWNVVDGTWKSGPMPVDKFKAGDAKAEYDVEAYLKAMTSTVNYYNQNPVTKKYDDVRKNAMQLASRIHTKGWDEGCKVQFNDAKEYTSLCFQDLVANYKASAGSRFRSLHKQPVAGWVTTDAASWTFKSFLSTSKRVGESIGAKFTINKKGASAAAIKSITISATFVEYTGSPLGEPIEVKSVAVNGDSQTVELNLDTPEFWRKALAVLKSTQAIRFNYHVVSVQGAVLHFETRTYVMQLPKLTMLGANTIRKGNKISCNVQFSNPFPFELGAATLQVRISGDATDAFFERNIDKVPAKVAGAPATSYRVNFENVQVKAMVPGQHWIMGSLLFKDVAQQMPVFGLNDLAVTD